MRTIKVLEKPALFGLKQQTVVIKKHLGVHSSSITLLEGQRMLLEKLPEIAGLEATLQSNKSPTSNSSIKVSPKTFKVVHSFSKKERHWKGFATLHSCWYYTICHDIIPSHILHFHTVRLFVKTSFGLVFVFAFTSTTIGAKNTLLGLVWCITKVQIHILLYEDSEALKKICMNVLKVK